MSDHPSQPRLLSQQTDELLTHTIHRILTGLATAGEVTPVLRRVCVDAGNRPPELIIIRIRQLWSKVAEGSRVAFAERDRRYFAFIGECLELYHCVPRGHAAAHLQPRDRSSANAPR